MIGGGADGTAPPGGSKPWRGISASILMASITGILIWRKVDTGLHAAVAQVGELRNAAPVINSVPTSLQESTGSLQASEDPAQLDVEAQSRRLNKFFLDRYYPDLQKEAGFTSDDVDKLVQLKGSDEADVEKGLGAAKYQHWKEYEAKVQSEDAVNSLGKILSGDDQLREDQAAMLYRTIFDERRRRDEELRARAYAASSDLRSRIEFEFGNLEIKEESDRRLLAAARDFLSEAQFAALPEAVVDPNVAKGRDELEGLRARMENRPVQ